MAETDFPEGGSEFGGVPGMIQPPPHELTPAEERMLQVAVRPDTSHDSREKALRRLNEGGEYEYGEADY